MWSSSFLSLITGDEVLPVPPVTWSEVCCCNFYYFLISVIFCYFLVFDAG